MVKHKKSTILEWVIILGLTVCAIAVSEVVGLTPLWQDAVVYTVVVFAVVLTALRPPWGRREFWQSLAAVFIGHTFVLLLALMVLQEFPAPRRFGMPKLLLVPVGAVECVFVGGMLWKKITALRTSGLQS
jgi:peptidoglycan/LPS O-acetylase OafA/YrhL